MIDYALWEVIENGETLPKTQVVKGVTTEAKERPNYALMAFSSSSSNSEVSNDSTCSKSCLKTIKLLKSPNDQLLKDLEKSELMVLGNSMPPTPNLSFTGLDEFVNKPVVKNFVALHIELIKTNSLISINNEFVNKPVVENCKAKSSEEEPKVVIKNDEALIIEEWVSDNEEEDVSQPKIKKKTVRPSTVKTEFVKSKQ
nr:hypothetical protein [Tanacetum cinerariifolium]